MISLTLFCKIKKDMERKYLLLILVGMIISVFTSCEKEVLLVNPLITTAPFEAAPLDTITTTIIGELEIDGEIVQIDSYSWKVFDQENNEITLLSTNNEIMKWVPLDEGVFNIEVLVESGNKGLKEIKQINIKHNTTSIQCYLTGSWHGNGVATFAGGIEWEADFNIEENGHYSAIVTDVHSGSISSVFDNGDDSMDHPEKKFIVTNIDGNGNAIGTASFVHWGGDLLEYQFKDLIFSNNYNTVNFTVFWGAEMTYQLERQ